MNINNIFKNFETVEPILPTEIIYINKENPLFWVGMFRKILYNQRILSFKLLKILKEDQNSVDEIDILNFGEYVAYNKAYNYIYKVKLYNHYHQEILSKCINIGLLTEVKTSILYFKRFEEYEKCLHLFEIKNFIESFF